MAKSSTNLSNRGLIHAVARLHYVDGLSQLEVSRKMDLSTAMVSRLLARAREVGIVHFHVADLDELDEIGDRLKASLGLKQVRVVEAPERGSIAALSAQVRSLLQEAPLGPGSVIAIGWGRTIQGIVSAGLPEIPAVTVVPAMGGMHESEAHFQINEFTRLAAEQMRGEAHLLHAPCQPSVELHTALLADPVVARVRSRWANVDAALLGIGNFRHATSNREAVRNYSDPDSIVGDVVRRYFREDGHLADPVGQTRLLAIGEKELRRIPLCIAIAVGRNKAGPIIGAARSGLINTLVTDTKTARHVLDQLDAGE